MNIVSLLPSATEIICSLGLQSQLVGVSHECDYPTSVALLPHVTRSQIPSAATSAEIDEMVRKELHNNRALYSLNEKTLKDLQPDLIVTQALCEVCAVAKSEVLSAAKQLASQPKVVNLEPETLSQVLDSIRMVADAADVSESAESVIRALVARTEQVQTCVAKSTKRPRIAFLEWLDPPFSSGHWTPELVAMAGGIEILAEPGQRSRTLTWNEIASTEPDIIFIACCGFDETRSMQDVRQIESLPQWKSLPAVRNNQVYVTNGSAYFSRPGPRLVDSLEMLAATFHPDCFELPAGVPLPTRVV